MAKLKHGLSGLTAGQLVGKCRHIETEMDGNTSFPSPTPTLSDIADKREELQAAISAASNGDRKAIGIRNEVHGQLETMLKTLSEYVSMMAVGSETIIQSSGFEVANNSKAPKRVTRPKALSLVRGENKGEMLLDWKRVPYSRSYIVQRTTTDPALPETVWEQITLPTRANYTDNNLTPGVHYWYRVKAVGSVNESAFSDVALIMAA